jgi:hypothetical protein
VISPKKVPTSVPSAKGSSCGSKAAKDVQFEEETSFVSQQVKKRQSQSFVTVTDVEDEGDDIFNSQVDKYVIM